MATTKYTCPPQTASGQGTFSDNLVGLQLVQGGGLTQGNFEFTTSVTDKVNRSFETGVFSSPTSLTDLGLRNVEQSQKIYETNFKIYPNFDQTEVLNFVGYGSLSKRLSTAVTNIINFFPAGLESRKLRLNMKSGFTANNIYYNTGTSQTTFSIPVSAISNPFSVDFTNKSTLNISSLEYGISEYRDFTKTYINYVLDYSGNTYGITNLTATTSISAGTLVLSCYGNPFSGSSIVYNNFVIRPNDITVSKVFNLNLDEVEELLLNRISSPKYTAQFQVPTEADNGSLFLSYKTVTWPLDGQWNLDIRTKAFDSYLKKLNDIGVGFDEYQTNLVSRFYTTNALEEFDTQDQKVNKVLKIYGRSFDETKKYIDAIGYMTSVNYNIGNDAPSKLLTNIAQTLGWSTNISPITDTGFLNSLYGTYESNFAGQTFGYTVDELNYQYYRNLILNSAYLYKSKGTRKAIDFLMQNIGAPEALIEFNENVYVADSPIDMSQFDELYLTITGGTYEPTIPILDPTNVYRFKGVQYTAYTSSTTVLDVDITLDEFPIDSEGFPLPPTNNDDFFFQKGAGWYESTPQHRSPEVIDVNTSVFTGQNFDIQTQLEPFTYGQKYLERFRNFPYLNIGFGLRIQSDNKKSWTNSESVLRQANTGGYNSIYNVSDDRLVLNVKNIDLFLNPGQGLVYDVWYLSNTKNYPIPYTGLSNPYPQVGGIDSTVIDPKPQIDTFYEFSRTFWRNMINARSRQYSSDGKTSGYVTLESIFWKYLTMYEDVGIQNNNFTYQKMIEYVNGIGSYWIDLVEQFIPASTIWNTGTNYENSIFHRQKFIYRRQVGCRDISQYIPAPEVVTPQNPTAPQNVISQLEIDMSSQYQTYASTTDTLSKQIECPNNNDPIITSISINIILMVENINSGNIAESTYISNTIPIDDNNPIINETIYIQEIEKAVIIFNQSLQFTNGGVLIVTYDSADNIMYINTQNTTTSIGNPTLTYDIEFGYNCP